MPRTSRREFARRLAAAGLAAPLALAQSNTAAPAAETKPRNALGDALTEVVRANHGRHLTPAELEQIRSGLQDYAPYIESFRAFPLTNADEPDFTFQPLAERW